MALSTELAGLEGPKVSFAYTWRDAVLYALGIGAKANELEYLFEKFGPKVMPTFAVLPAFAASEGIFDKLGGNIEGLVHGAQSLRVFRDIAPNGTLHSQARVIGAYDLKRLATVTLGVKTLDDQGELVSEAEFDLIFRFDGGFGGTTPPKKPLIKVPDRAADWRVEEHIASEQALLYRLSGDHNPLHADPELAKKVGFEKPILHGLCTYGYVARAVSANAPHGKKLSALNGSFQSPVLPGQTLIVEGWNEDGRVLLRATTKEQPDQVVFGKAFAEFI